ncbi:MAG: RsmF rRNA methyltransferase first C-terminal domain-containing protein [Bacteroidales bacterium]|nr:RsmF rRNA methyltransferase first C-terminal domain-containing protein [Lachnoclostridium sp.]MCM1384719.1 RsmF rRNA methyltransferase first C-terminal domain-containing protein [Lachnoclostridium sp.]MCM1465267.1 RsmF rRNA methyltransferase first C-terminal domain-containing protein [Bacteroidales bacterium]
MLPELFLKRMEETLGEEYGDFLESLKQEPFQALRWNPLKLTAGNLSNGDMRELIEIPGQKASFHLTKVPWEENGFYYENIDQPGKHPYHDAGLYYIQEPSAMAPAPLLEANPGERILDLCAAPGGKSTQIAAAMKGQGLLVCNEIHPARVKILSENIERMGVCNACVTNEKPERLAEFFPEYFDKILVDAPCSGEGMFRKNKEACEEWSPENVILCAVRQDEILDCAAGMLGPGGRLVYSTCTFAREEDEGSAERFLSRHPEFTCLEEKRLWPHKIKGEGHFAAVLRKEGAVLHRSVAASLEGGQSDTAEGRKHAYPKELEEFAAFVKGNLKDGVKGGVSEILREGFCRHQTFGSGLHGTRYLQFGDNLYLTPEGLPSLKGLKVLRPGLHLGTLKKDRFEPSHALALALAQSEVQRVWNLDSSGTEVLAYLNGQTFPAEGEKGWYLICVDGYSLGWGKLTGGMMKNHYPKGLRR